MLQFLFVVFVGLCLLLLLPGIRDTRRVYEFPFFMGVTFLGFMGPHIYAIVQRNVPMPEEIAVRGLTMTCLCVFCCWVGYNIRPSPIVLSKLQFPTSDRRLFHVGAAFALVSTYFFVMVRLHPGATGSQWTGSVLRYLFFVGLSAPALAICLYFALRKRRLSTLLFLGIAVLAPLYAVYIGRRGITFLFLVTIGFALYYVRNFRPPRWALAALIVAGLVHLFAIGEYRRVVHSGRFELSSLLDMNIERNLERAVGKRKASLSETAYGYYMLDSVAERQSYEFGAAFWNMLVVFYVPGQIVGHDFKKQLQINIGQGDFTDLSERLRVDLNTGTTLTGIYSAFKQFGYFGCLLFLGYGIAYRHLWAAVMNRQNKVLIALYPSMIIYGMYIVTHHVAYATTQFLFYSTFCIIGYAYARRDPGLPPRHGATTPLERPPSRREARTIPLQEAPPPPCPST